MSLFSSLFIPLRNSRVKLLKRKKGFYLAKIIFSVLGIWKGKERNKNAANSIT
jgi:hypothetical protein